MPDAAQFVVEPLFGLCGPLLVAAQSGVAVLPHNVYQAPGKHQSGGEQLPNRALPAPIGPMTMFIESAIAQESTHLLCTSGRRLYYQLSLYLQFCQLNTMAC